MWNTSGACCIWGIFVLLFLKMDPLTWVCLSAMHNIVVHYTLEYVVWSMPHSNEHCVNLKGCCASLVRKYMLWYRFRGFLNFCNRQKLPLCMGLAQVYNNFPLGSCTCISYLTLGKWKLVYFWQILLYMLTSV